MILLDAAHAAYEERKDAFEAFARRQADGAVFLPPLLLPRELRRLHVRQTLREDHQFRIRNRPEGAQAKFDKLADNAFTFFRGTALLFYRDHAGTDGYLPAVYAIGDVHPENFGVMPNEHDAPFFGLNDFDEAHYAPFSWDLKRGATGFFIAAKEQGFKKKRRKAIVRCFVQGYLDGLTAFAKNDREKWHQYRIDNSPPMIRELLEAALSAREEFLRDKVDLDKGRFVSSEEIVPYSKHTGRFQERIDAFREENEIPTDTRAGHFKVKDVAVKKGSGTASLGLDRYWVLIEGPSDDHSDDLILELKQTRTSALHGLVPPSAMPDDREDTGDADRIVMSHRIHLVGGDPYYGRIRIDDIEFLVRERSPYKDEIDITDLDADAFETYAGICGGALAQAHARSDEDTGIMDGDAEAQILSSIQPEVFVDDLVRFAKTAAKRLYTDFKLFKADHDLGAFRFVEAE